MHSRRSRATRKMPVTTSAIRSSFLSFSRKSVLIDSRAGMLKMSRRYKLVIVKKPRLFSYSWRIINDVSRRK